MDRFDWHGFVVSSVPNDYDVDPARWASLDRSTQLAGDVHTPVAALIVERCRGTVLDVGGGDGELVRHLPNGWPIVVMDTSRRMLQRVSGPRLLADAASLPVADRSVGAVTALWMLYHLDDPERAIGEAFRVLRPGGLFFASTSSRYNDPELVDEYPPTTFDAENAEEVVAAVFDRVDVRRWDAPMTVLKDRVAVERYCVHHLLDPATADRVSTPITLTKRGCLVVAVKPGG